MKCAVCQPGLSHRGECPERCTEPTAPPHTAVCWNHTGPNSDLMMEAEANRRGGAHSAWHAYRLADVITGSGGLALCVPGTGSFASAAKEEHIARMRDRAAAQQSGYCGPSGSIARLYSSAAVSSAAGPFSQQLVNSIPWAGIDFSALARAIDSYTAAAAIRSCPRPGSDTVVVHLRLGDTVRAGDWELDRGGLSGRMMRMQHHNPAIHLTGLPGRRGCPYVFPKDFYIAAVARFPSTVRKVLLVGSLDHSNSNDPEMTAHSLEYRKAASQFFEAQGFDVVHHWWGLPDEDFALMVRSSLFVPGGGGFAELVAACALKLGAEVIIPSPYLACFTSHLHAADHKTLALNTKST